MDKSYRTQPTETKLNKKKTEGEAMYEVILFLCTITVYVTDENEPLATPLLQTETIEMPYLNTSNSSSFVEHLLDISINNGLKNTICNTSRVTCTTLVHCQ